MDLLQKAENLQAYAKIGMLGFPGSGKTYTATMIAIGLAKLYGCKPIAFFDTETGSDFIITKVKDAGLELYVTKSRSFEDLIAVTREAEKECSVLIIDSLTHIWRELCEAYGTRLNRKRLMFQDWQIIKGKGGWQDFTDFYVNSKLNIIICGRAGYEYDFDMNEDGTKDLIKTGTRMKVEGEFGFEPSLVIEMERLTPQKDQIESIREMTDLKAKRQKKQALVTRTGSKWIHRAFVLKDRTDTLNGQQFDYPKFQDFLPHFSKLNIGGKHLGVDTSRTSGGLFDENGDTKWKQKQTQKKIVLEEIEGIIVKFFPGASAKEKKMKADIIEHLFNTRSWTKVCEMELSYLQIGLKELNDLLPTYKGEETFEEFIAHYLETKAVAAA